MQSDFLLLGQSPIGFISAEIGAVCRIPGHATDQVHVISLTVQLILTYLLFTGYDKCILVVHDWGGVVGFDTVLRYPDIIEKFIICNIPHPKGMQDAYNLKQFLMSW